MKKNLNKVSADFERMLSDEFQVKGDTKPKPQETADAIESSSRKAEKDNLNKNPGHNDQNSNHRKDHNSNGELKK